MYDVSEYTDKHCLYFATVERSIEYIRKTNEIPVDEKVKLFRYITKNNGATALCLSGGASFGYYASFLSSLAGLEGPCSRLRPDVTICLLPF